MFYGFYQLKGGYCIDVLKFFSIARKESYKSTYRKQKTGCVFVYKNRVIAKGHNQDKTNPLQKHYNRFRGFDKDSVNNGLVHAEMQCLINTKELELNWSKVSVFVYRETKDGNISISKPCVACRNALKERGIKTIFYTIKDGYSMDKILDIH